MRCSTKMFRAACLSGCVTLVIGCSPPPNAMLHQLPAFAGTVRIRPEGTVRTSPNRSVGSTVWQLGFARSRGHVQAKLRIGGRVVTLLQGGDGEVSAFENAVEREPSPDERVRFGLIEDLLDPSAVEVVRPAERGYRVRRRGTWYHVELEMQSVHGH